MDKSLKSVFEPKSLTQLGVMGHELIVQVAYHETAFEKTGVQAVARKLPVIKSLQPFKSATLQMDVDLSCVMLDNAKNLLDVVWYGQLRNANQSVRHGGDGLVGAMGFEETLMSQESITVRLLELPKEVAHLVFVVSSYHKHPLNKAKKGISTLTDNEGHDVYEFDLATTQANEWALLAWHIFRQGDEFVVSAPQKSLSELINPKSLKQDLEKVAQVI